MFATAGVLLALPASGADAAFLGIQYEHKVPSDHGRQVLNIYAAFDNPNDHMLSVSGTAENPLEINLDVPGAIFYQNAFGGDTAPNPGLIPVFPSLADDTFVTIGRKTAIDDQTQLTSGWPGFGASSLGGPDVGWYISPDDEQGAPDADGRVLLMQLAVENTEYYFFMSASFQISAISDGDANFTQHVSFSTPAPSSVALLGVALLAGRRRRR